MIQVRFFHKEGRIRAFRVRGHAGFAPSGKDIVCAAVSALSESTVNGLMYANVPVGCSVDDARLDCYVAPRNERQNHQASALLDALWLSIRQLQAQYPDFVRMIDTEWR